MTPELLVFLRKQEDRTGSQISFYSAGKGLMDTIKMCVHVADHNLAWGPSPFSEDLLWSSQPLPLGPGASLCRRSLCFWGGPWSPVPRPWALRGSLLQEGQRVSPDCPAAATISVLRQHGWSVCFQEGSPPQPTDRNLLMFLGLL